MEVRQAVPRGLFRVRRGWRSGVLHGSEIRRGTPGVGAQDRGSQGSEVMKGVPRGQRSGQGYPGVSGQYSASRGRRSGLGCLQAGKDGKDEVPERRVLSDEESGRVGVCVLQTHNIHDLHYTQKQPQHDPMFKHVKTFNN